MKISKYFLLAVGIILLLFSAEGIACTTFCLQNNGDWIYGRNYDWFIEHCLIVVNKHGVEKTALTEDNPAQLLLLFFPYTYRIHHSIYHNNQSILLPG